MHSTCTSRLCRALPGKNPAIRRIRPLLFILTLIFICLFTISCQDKEDYRKIRIDMRHRESIPKTCEGTNGAESLRIAIAAMISPEETFDIYRQLVDYIGKHLGKDVRIIQRKTYQEVNDLLENRLIDIAFVCAGPYVEGRKKFGMEAIAVPVVNGCACYHAYFIVNRHSNFKSISDLRGRTFAFTDPLSNTGALVPTYVLSKMGETPSSFFSRVIFTHSHDNSIMAVSKGIADGASVDSLIYDFFAKYQPDMVQETRIIYTSRPFGIPPVVVNPSTPAMLKARLRQILLRMEHDSEGASILKKLNIERFEIPDDSLYDSVRQMREWIGNSR